jgi:Arc/MetJ family transcription regulator
MRARLTLSDDLLSQARELTDLTSTEDVVWAALRALIEREEARASLVLQESHADPDVGGRSAT